MKKKIISGILCAVMAVSTFAGLSIVEVKADDKNTIVVWMKKDLTDVANNMFRERCEKFAEENDVWIKPVYMDLSSEESVKNAAKEILSEKRKIDILVNNAGIAFAGTLSMTPMSRVRETFEVNFFAMLALIQMISKQMIRNKDGNIVNIGSVSGLENSCHLGN